MSFKHSERLQRGVGVPMWPANEAEWDLWHARNANAVEVVKSVAGADHEQILDMLGLLPEQLEAAEDHMRTAANSGGQPRAHVVARRFKSTTSRD